jgi:hypothetical protein
LYIMIKLLICRERGVRIYAESHCQHVKNYKIEMSKCRSCEIERGNGNIMGRFSGYLEWNILTTFNTTEVHFK